MLTSFPKSSSAAGEGLVVIKCLPNGRPVLESIAYQYPLKLISPSRPTETQSVLVFLLSYGGGLVGGDAVDFTIEVHPSARLCIATQGHTKVFASTHPSIITRQSVCATIRSGASLCLLPDPVQPFRDSVYEQLQVFKLAADASLCLLDWVTQGRLARGEDWNCTRWVGRNEVWVTESPGFSASERLLVRDVVILDRDQADAHTKSLKESMHGNGVFGTLILRGPLMKFLGDFFLSEFAALPRVGSQDFRTARERADEKAKQGEKSTLEIWRSRRLEMEKTTKLLWSAARVRGCVVVKFGAPAVESMREWIYSMLVEEGGITREFGQQALTCLR